MNNSTQLKRTICCIGKQIKKSDENLYITDFRTTKKLMIDDILISESKLEIRIYSSPGDIIIQIDNSLKGLYLYVTLETPIEIIKLPKKYIKNFLKSFEKIHNRSCDSCVHKFAYTLTGICNKQYKKLHDTNRTIRTNTRVPNKN